MHINKPLTKVEEILIDKPKALSFMLKDFEIIDSYFRKKHLAHFEKNKQGKDRKETFILANELHDRFERKAKEAKCYYIDMYNDGIDIVEIEREILNEYDINL